MLSNIRLERLYIYIAFFSLVLSESIYANQKGLNSILEYAGYFILLISIFKSYLKKNINSRWLRRLCLFCIIVILMSAGFLTQNLTCTRKIILLMTVIGISTVTLLSENYITEFEVCRNIPYVILWAVFVASVLSIYSGYGIVEGVDSDAGGFFPVNGGLNGGITYKNYFAADLIIVFAGIYLYNKNDRKRRIDEIVLLIISILILMSNSRGGILLFAIFIVSVKGFGLTKIKKDQRGKIFFLFLFLCILIFKSVFESILLDISTYAYRYRGLVNFFEYFRDDWHRLFLGISDLVYDQPESYTVSYRLLVGWNGSLEIAWVNILIKSGLLGVLSYMIILVSMLKRILIIKDQTIRIGVMALFILLIASSFVEAYIQSVHSIFGIFGYLMISGLGGAYGQENEMKV